MKKKLANNLLNFKKILFNNFNFKKTLISVCLGLLSIFLLFPAGSLSSKTIDELCADYYAEISREHTYDIGPKKLSGLLVEPKDGKNSKMRYDTDRATSELWGVFKGENASFAPVMNSNKKNEIYFSDNHFSNESLTLVYSNIGSSSEVYHIDEKTKDPIDYKFQSCPLALMFSSSNSGVQDKFHIYISQAQAERKLIKEEKDITKENLQGIQGTNTQLIIDGTPYDCIIDNIYLDNFEHTFKQPVNPKTNSRFDYYYATDIGTIIGDFVFVSLYALRENAFPSSLKRQSLYVMSEYSFRNKFYLEYAKECYDPDNYSFDYVRTNLKKGFSPNDKILQRTLIPTTLNVWCILITIFSFACFIINIITVYRFKTYRQPLSSLIVFITSFIPYLIFRIIFKVSNNTLFFSSYSLILNLVLIALLAFAIFAFNCFGCEPNRGQKNV